MVRTGATCYTIITGAYSTFDIDYSNVLVSRGDLPNASTPSAASAASGTVDFSWVNNSGVGKAQPTDTSVLVVYSADRNQCIYTTAGAARSTGSALLSVPAFKGLNVETYIGFLSADGKSIASSVYTGQVTVAS